MDKPITFMRQLESSQTISNFLKRNERDYCRADNSSIGRPELQRFVGALQGKRAKKGIFITTAKFSSGAKDYAGNIDAKVVLIDGQRSTELMIDYGIGVSTRTVYELKDLDTDFFGNVSA